MNKRTPPSIRIGVSACLLGKKVRFDAQDEKHPFISEVMAKHVKLVPICPEVELGMGIPRERARLEGSVDSPGMVGIETGHEWTGRMIAYAHKRVRRRNLADICGYVLKTKSPSCGRVHVKLYDTSGRARRAATGLFAAALISHNPLLPVDDERAFDEATKRDSFIVRLFAYRRLRDVLEGRQSRAGLRAFHVAHTSQLQSHSPKHYRMLDELVTSSGAVSARELCDRYAVLFMEALRFKSTVAKSTTVLRRLVRLLRGCLSATETSDIGAAIDAYRTGHAPLLKPLTLIRQSADKYEVAWVSQQVYLNPDPTELILRAGHP